MLSIEKKFIERNSAKLRVAEAKGLIAEINLMSRKGLEKSLIVGEILHQAKEWYKSAEGKAEIKEVGWDMITFLKEMYNVSEAAASRQINAFKVDNKVIGEFKRKCTTAKNNGEAVSESVVELLKFAKGEGQFYRKAKKGNDNRLGSITVNVVDGKVELKSSGKLEIEDLLALINRANAGADVSEILAKLTTTK